MNAMRRGFRVVVVWLSWMTISAAVAAQDEAFPDPAMEIRTYEWTITPAAESSPALKHRLFPDITETIPGNAAIHYLRACVTLAEVPRPALEQSQRESDWFGQRCHELPIAEVKEWLARRQWVLDEIAAASRCEACDWGIRFQDLRGRDVIQMRLMEFQQTRQLARILKLKAQVEIYERRFTDAVATIRMLYRLAHDIGKAPNVIVSLISVAVTAITNDVTGELIESDGAPNLYWGLRTLPNPITDGQSALRLDANMVFQWFPFLKDAETVHRTGEEWQKLLSDAIHEMRQLTVSGPTGNATDVSNRLSTAVLILRTYAIAKRELIAQGMDLAQVDGMPTGQVVAIYARDCFRHVSDEYMKWSSLPFHEGQARLVKLDEQLRHSGYLKSGDTSFAEHDPLGINQALISAYAQIGEAYGRQKRMISLLATVEAIRLHAAANQGKFPEHLSDVVLVPVPLDPCSMKPFLYRVIDGRAELVAVPTVTRDQYSGRRFLLRME